MGKSGHLTNLTTTSSGEMVPTRTYISLGSVFSGAISIPLRIGN